MQTVLSHIRDGWPWLQNALISSDEAVIPSPVPLWLRAGCRALSSTFSGGESRPVVLVVPSRSDVARWIALFFAIEKFREGFPVTAARQAGSPLVEGCRIIVSPENRAYTYVGRTAEGFIRLKCADGINEWRGNLSPLRIRRAETGGRPGLLSSINRHPASHCIAKLIDADPHGHPGLFKDNVVLIDSISGSQGFYDGARIRGAGDSHALPDRIRDFDREERLVTTMRYAAEIPNRFPQTERKWVVINGLRRLEGYERIPQLVRNHNILVIAAASDIDRVRCLGDMADIWHLDDDRWLVDDHTDNASARICNYAHRKWSPQQAENHRVQTAVEHLGAFCGLLAEADLSDAQSLVGKAWGLVLDAANRTRGYNENQKRDFLQRLAGFENDVEVAKRWLTVDQETVVSSAINELKLLANEQQGLSHPKGSLIYSVANQAGSVAIVVRSENEAISIRDRLHAKQLDVHVSPAAEFDPHTARFELVIIAGWLKSPRMREIYTSGCAQRIVLIGYKFEILWLKSLVQRIEQRGNAHCANSDEKLWIIEAPADIHEWPACVPHPIVEWPRPKAQVDADGESAEPHFADLLGTDIWDFELKLEHRRKGHHPAPTTGIADAMLVRYVSFAGSGYGFFSEERRLPVITSLSANNDQRLPNKRVDGLRPGDLVVFPQIGNSELIESVADKLIGSDAEATRRAALQYSWKLQNSKLTGSEFVRRATSLGFTKKAATVNQWIEGSRVIGPGDDHDIEIIQTVVGGTTWAAQCIEARTKLLAAHSRAESLMREALLRKLGSHLEAIEAEGARIELGELGSVWVQCVESVAQQLETRPRSICNHLLGMD